MNTRFIFHNVGQGLFYSGRIDNFNFVYDCGSLKIDRQFLTKSIAKYKNDVDKLNLLILSHLHEDHVAGLNYLLKDMEVHTAVLPYFLPLERLIISLARLDHPRWYYEFLSDPVNFLLGKGVKQLVLIDGSQGRYPEFPPSLGSYENEEPDIRQLPKDNRLLDKVRSHDPQLEKLFDKKLFLRNHDGYITALGKWFFRFFNYKVSKLRLKNFKKCIKSVFGPYYDLVSIIKGKSLSLLRPCYHRIRVPRNFNDTSLVAYHGPINPTDETLTTQFHCFLPYCNFLQFVSSSTCPYSFTIRCSFRQGQFLMGDINLNTDFKEIKRHYQPYFSEAFLIQIPHHGAVRNWNTRILKMPHSGTLWVASAGTRNRFSHPNPKVISDIKKNHHFLWCSEFTEIETCGTP